MKLNKLIVLARTGYDLLVKGATLLQSPLLLVIRLYWGYEFFLSGKGKLADLSGPTEYFATLHIPFPAFNAALAGTTECVGGLFLLLGFATRLTAIPLIVTMLVAYITAERDSWLSITITPEGQKIVSYFSDPDKFFAATPFLFLFATVLIFVFGPGAFSIDRLIGRKLTAFADRAAREQEPAKAVIHESARAIAS